MKLNHILGALALTAAATVSGLGIAEAHESATRPPARPYAVSVAPSAVPSPASTPAAQRQAAWEAYEDLTDGCKADFDMSYRGIFWGDSGDIAGTSPGWSVKLAPYVDGTCTDAEIDGA